MEEHHAKKLLHSAMKIFFHAGAKFTQTS